MAVILLIAIALPLSANTAFATTNISDTNSSQINPSTDQNSANVTDQSSNEINNANATTQSNTQTSTEQTEKTQAATQTAATPTSQATTTQASTEENSSSNNLNNSNNIAAGSAQSATTVSSQTSFTSAQINDASTRVKNFVETNHRLPNYVTIGSYQVGMPQFLDLMAQSLLNIKNGLTTSVTLKTVTSPTSPAETVKSGNILQSEYLSLAQSIESAISSTGSAPNYINTSLGQMRFESLVYNLSKILNFQATNQRLPNYVSVTPWTGSSSSSSEGSGSTGTTNSTIPASVQQYLAVTANAQSNSPTIIALANSITSGLTSTYDKAAAIFNWVRNNISYSYYYNTQKGALGTLSSRTANCCDTSHLVVALARAAGIPARYQQGYCHFSDGWYGHVWAQLYVNGQWYYADAISKQNTFGAINNWNLNTYTLEGTFASLPF